MVGAGPGDPGLLTLRAAQFLRRADVLALRRARRRFNRRAARLPDASVSSSANAAAITQCRKADIRSADAPRSPAGQHVVRLKGGDPFVFGRGGEEARSASRGRHRIRNRSGHYRRPLPRRPMRAFPHPSRARRRFHRATGHEDPDEAGVDARLGNARRSASHARVSHGDGKSFRDRATADRERARRGDAGGRHCRWNAPEPAHRARHARNDCRRRRGGGLTRAGRRRDRRRRARAREIRWFDAAPLFGKRVLVTRAGPQADVFRQRAAGARRRADRGADDKNRPRPTILPRSARARRTARLRLARPHVAPRRRRALSTSRIARRTRAISAARSCRHWPADAERCLDASVFAPTSCRRSSSAKRSRAP